MTATLSDRVNDVARLVHVQEFMQVAGVCVTTGAHGFVNPIERVVETCQSVRVSATGVQSIIDEGLSDYG